MGVGASSYGHFMLRQTRPGQAEAVASFALRVASGFKRIPRDAWGDISQEVVIAYLTGAWDQPAWPADAVVNAVYAALDGDVVGR